MTKPVLPPEARLLLFATRAPHPDDDRAIDELVAGPLNWRRAGALAEREKLLPVLWNRLRGHTNVVPPEIAERIHAQAAVTEFRMAMTETVLQEVVRRLAAENIRVMLLKGAALATTVYPSFAARPMGDLDILVRPEEARRAWQCLVDAGWVPEYEGEAVRFYDGHHHLVALMDPQGLQLVLEVHRAMLPTAGPFILDENEIWNEAEPVIFGETTVWVPSVRHQLLHLSVHFAWSNMLLGGLGRTLRDIVTLVDANDVDWDDFVELAHATLGASCAYWTLELAHALSGARVPVGVLRRLRPRGIGILMHPLERAHAASALAGACPSLYLLRLLWIAAIRPTASGHGRARPWKVGESFGKSFQIPQASPAARMRAQLGGAATWFRFAGMVVLPRRLT